MLVEPLTVARERRIQWVRPRLDLAELAKLRERDWPMARIARESGVGVGTVWRKLRLLDL